MKASIGIAVVTLRAKHHLPHCLTPWLNSSLKPRVVVVDSSSDDGTVELAQEMGVEVLVIPRGEFNHGLTREKARKFLNTDIVVMLTQDAYAVDENILEHLVNPLLNGEASVSYARQIPHKGADFFESFPREYNYPNESHIRRWTDREKYGVYTIFCSDSCSAYLNSALEEVGGFPEVLIGEDTLVVSKILQKGHAIAYVAEAKIHHSHRYSLNQEFKRHFDTGLSRKTYREWLQGLGKDTSRGRAFAVEMMKHLFKYKPKALPYGVLYLAAKWFGYKLGSASLHAPIWWKRAFSSQNFYWNQNNNL